MTKKNLLFLLFFTTHFIANSQNKQLLASCCETSEARCTGSASYIYVTFICYQQLIFMIEINFHRR